MRELDIFYESQQEPTKGCLLALRDIVLSQDKDITHVWKYKTPFFCYKGKMFCYLWIHKKYKQPYLGIVEGQRLDYPELIAEKRSRIKIMLLNPTEDLPIEPIVNILQDALNLSRTEVVKVR